MAVPFQRVAISRLFGTEPGSLTDEAATVQQVLAWSLAAQKKGADALMLREPALPQAWLPGLLELLQGRLPGVPILLNTGLVDLRLPAAGFHLKSDSALVPAAFPEREFWLGKSCHTLEELRAADASGFDYAFLSPIFPTHTHPDAAGLGLPTLKTATAAVRLPVFALGGMDEERWPATHKAGAQGYAAIQHFQAH